MLSVFMSRFIYTCAECHYVESRYAEFHYVECRHTQSNNAKYRFPECLVSFNFMVNVIMLSLAMLNGIMLSVDTLNVLFHLLLC
jgi:hypothetical protein